MKIEYAGYRTRVERQSWLAQRFEPIVGDSVLGVGGGGDRSLAGFLAAHVKYTEIDIAGRPDVLLDLERQLPLPFDSSSFDTVVCTEVLEHVDNLHDVFREVIRVARKHVIVSLPNSPIVLFRYLRGKALLKEGGQFGRLSKYYGLPFDRPPDRHKWFFAASDVDHFVEFTSLDQKMAVEAVFLTPTYTGTLARAVHRASRLFGIRRMVEDFSGGSVWLLLCKR